MKKTTIFILTACLALCLTGCASQSETSSQQQSQPSSETQMSYEQLTSQVQVNTQSVEQTAAAFIAAYYTIDTTKTGVYDPQQQFDRYKGMLTDTAQSTLAPQETQTDEVRMQANVTQLKTYTSAYDDSTASTLSLVTVVTDVEGIQTEQTHLINLKFKYLDDKWFVDLFNFDQTVSELSNITFV